MIAEFPITPLQRIQLSYTEKVTLDLTNVPAVREMQAYTAECHLHIDSLHAAVKNMLELYHSDVTNVGQAVDLKNAVSLVRQLVEQWEADQCPF